MMSLSFVGSIYAWNEKYFNGKQDAYAIQIKNVEVYDKPINPYDKFENFIAPQSYKYVDSDFIFNLTHNKIMS